MYEEAREIFNYLPIRSSTLSVYIDHLWGAFEGLIEKEEPVRAFSILPFHLLFMFAIQYRVYRISAHYIPEYLKTLKKCRLKAEDKRTLEVNPPIPDLTGIVSGSCSVRNLSFLHEKDLFNFLKIINVDEDIIAKAEELVEIRGSYAHANGNIEENIERRIEEYLAVLREIHPKFIELNKATMREWTQEITDEDVFDEFIERKLIESFFCPKDFEDVTDNLVDHEEFTDEQWLQVVNKGLEFSYSQAIIKLKDTAQYDPNDARRFEAIQILDRNNELGDELKISLRHDRNDAIVELLRF